MEAFGQTLGEANDVRTDELELATSVHTGRPLRQVRASFLVTDEQSGAVSATLSKARDPENALEGACGTRWVVMQSSYSYQEGDRVHRHTVEVREVEVIESERLEFRGLVLAPKRH